MKNPIGHQSTLYPRLLGKAWSQMPRPIHRAHETGTIIDGRFQITHGRSWIAKTLARLSRLPRAAEKTDVKLKIVEQGDEELWERSFDDVLLVTRQWASSDGLRLLVERFNGWDLSFELGVEDGSLFYSQRRAHLAFGPLRIRMPLALAPHVRAKESCVDGGEVHVSVIVSLPLVGLLIAYDGSIKPSAASP